MQFFRIQVLQAEKWQAIAERQHERFVRDVARRGRFYSNTYLQKGHPPVPVPFVIDVPIFHLFADPSEIPAKLREEVSGQLAQFFPGKKESFQSELEKKSRSRKLATALQVKEKEEIANWWFPYAKARKIAKNALYFVQDFQRAYPFGKLLGPVLHTLRKERDPKTGNPIPTGGLERMFDAVLQGRDGKRLIKRSARNALETGKVVIPLEHGADIVLTINHYLQAIVEEGIAKAAVEANAQAAWGILMDPYTGEIWALAQYPWFDPSKYADYFQDAAQLAHTKVKAITDVYEPGSTFKPITMAIALKANAERKKSGKPPLFLPEEKLSTKPSRFPGRSKPISDTRLHEWLNLPMAIQKSSNVYLAKIIQRVVDSLGPSWYRNALETIFGFGQKTGIELPAESSGLLPRMGKVHPNGKMEWSTATPFSLAFGHNILVNSMQLLRAYAIIANGGFDVRPTVIRSIVKERQDGSTEVILDNHAKKSVQQRVRLLEPEIVREVVHAMKYVTKPGGGGVIADIPRFTRAGKTRTSEKIVKGVYSKKNHIATFVGFAPAEHPRFVLFVAFDEPEHKWVPGKGRNHMGGTCAAPAFREIGRQVLEYLGVEPDDPFNEDWKSEAQALRELYHTWNGHY